MQPYIAAIVLFLSSAWAFAQQQEEEPLEPNMLGIWVFLAVLVLGGAWAVWWLMKSGKKKEKREGDKF